MLCKIFYFTFITLKHTPNVLKQHSFRILTYVNPNNEIDSSIPVIIMQFSIVYLCYLCWCYRADVIYNMKKNEMRNKK